MAVEPAQTEGTTLDDGSPQEAGTTPSRAATAVRKEA